MNIILNSHNVLFQDLSLMKRFKLKSVHIWDWRLIILKELLHMRDYNCFNFLNAYEIIFY